MNREIKFRAWDKSNQSMWNGGFYLLFNPCSLWADSEDGPQEMPLKDFELMQYTGLLDRNGKEIYEGDILTDNIIVDWCSITAGFCLNKKGWMFPHYFKEALDADKVEIIGNIWENKEILK